MADLKSAGLIYFKGFLFAFGALLSGILIVIEHPSLKVLLLVGLTMWCSARFYYFVFYVIEKYVDNNYKFAGLGSFVQYMLRQHQKKEDQGNER